MNKIRKVAPIRYAGSKTRKTDDLYHHFKHLEFDDYYECFLGGGSVAIYISQLYPDKQVYVNDANPVLINFWKVLQKDSSNLVSELIKIRKKYKIKDYVKGREMFNIMKETLYDNNKTDLERAVSYFVLNKVCFSGMTESNSFSKSNYDELFSEVNINKLPFFSQVMKNWTIYNEDFSLFLLRSTNKDFIYLDPPYNIEGNKLYGKSGRLHQSFNHEQYKQCVYDLSSYFLMSYNDTLENRNKYKHYKIENLSFEYCMQSGSGKRQMNELIIKNF